MVINLADLGAGSFFITAVNEEGEVKKTGL